MEALPYYKWLWQRFRASRNVQRMGYVARGLYRELLDEQWDKGFVPEDIEQLAHICDCPVDVMQAEWPKISPCFIRKRKGVLVSGLMESIRSEAESKRTKAVRAGAKGGTAKANHISVDVANAKQLLEQSKRTLSDCHIGEERRVEEIREKQEAKASVRPEEFANTWNRNRANLPKVDRFTESRRKKVQARMREGITLERFEEAVKCCRGKPFLRGDNDRGWIATFDWLVENDKNIEKAITNPYAGGANGKPNNRPSLAEIAAESDEGTTPSDSDASGPEDGRGFLAFIRNATGQRTA